MELYLQLGHGMPDIAQELIRSWQGGTAILSPRDAILTSQVAHAKQFHRIGGRVLFDPQFYFPRANKTKLVEYPYWPRQYDTGGFWNKSEVKTLLDQLYGINLALECDGFILPGLYTPTVDDDWLGRQRTVVAEAMQLGYDERDMYLTVALGPGAVRDAEQIEAIIDAARGWYVGGIYLVCEHPDESYLVDDAVWLSRILDLVAGLRRGHKRVVLGYCNHQMLIAACASATAIASGNWMNVRSFSRSRFYENPDDERRHGKWYYHPESLSEYSETMLDVAYEIGALPRLATPSQYGSPYLQRLFNGDAPSDSPFAESDAFLHYLQCLKVQAENARKGTFDATVAEHRSLLQTASRRLDSFSRDGISGRTRSFSQAIEANEGALAILGSTQATMLRRDWQGLR